MTRPCPQDCTCRKHNRPVCPEGCICGKHKGQIFEANYSVRHARLHKERGRATDYECVDCDGPAEEWAQIHTEDGLDPWADYVPLCHQCHTEYDHESRVSKVSASKMGRKRGPLPDQWRNKISATQKGRSKSEETKQKIRAATQGKTRTAEQKENIRIGQSKRKDKGLAPVRWPGGKFVKRESPPEAGGN